MNRKVNISQTLGLVSIHYKKFNTYHISIGTKTAEMLGIYDYKLDKLTAVLVNEKPCLKYATIDDLKGYKLSRIKSIIYFTITLDYQFTPGIYILENLGTDIYELIWKSKF